jgi:hypothetical protein
LLQITRLQKSYSERGAEIATSADNEIVFRVRVITVAAVAFVLLAAVTTASARSLLAANCSCVAFKANGSGSVTLTASSSAVLGQFVGKGTLWVHGSASVKHWGTRTWDSSAQAWKFTGRGMTFQAWGGGLRVKAQGSNVAVSATAQGTAFLKGTGSYRINEGRGRQWPSSPIQLRG